MHGDIRAVDICGPKNAATGKNIGRDCPVECTFVVMRGQGGSFGSFRAWGDQGSGKHKPI